MEGDTLGNAAWPAPRIRLGRAGQQAREKAPGFPMCLRSHTFCSQLICELTPACGHTARTL